MLGARRLHCLGWGSTMEANTCLFTKDGSRCRSRFVCLLAWGGKIMGLRQLQVISCPFFKGGLAQNAPATGQPKP